MHRNDILPLALCVAWLAPAAAIAGEWSGELGAGYLATDGNSQTQSSNAKVHSVFKENPWTNTFDASGVNTNGSAGTTAERYAAADKVDYLFSERNYAFILGDWEKDLFGPVRERTTEAVGVGRHFLVGPVHLLDGEIGAGARQSEESATGVRRNEAIGRLGARYEWKFTDTNSLIEAIKSEGGEDNIYTESVTQLKLQVIGRLAAALAYTVRNNSEVPPGREPTDTETSVNLVWAFGG